MLRIARRGEGKRPTAANLSGVRLFHLIGTDIRRDQFSMGFGVLDPQGDGFPNVGQCRSFCFTLADAAGQAGAFRDPRSVFVEI
jgi:hypothetical protein